MRPAASRLGGAVLVLLLAGCVDRAPEPGRIAPAEPEQGDAGGAPPFRHGDCELTPLATFVVEARVLSARRYRFDREAELVPVDLALGWGPMSDGAVLDGLRIRQGFRAFSWRASELPIPREEIERHCANVHVIPASRSVERALERARRGDVVRIEGWLVAATAEDGWSWSSSLSRADTGAGACELVYARAIQVR